MKHIVKVSVSGLKMNNRLTDTISRKSHKENVADLSNMPLPERDEKEKKQEKGLQILTSNKL